MSTQFPTAEELLGKPLCPYCGLNLDEEQDLWEVIRKTEVDINYAEMYLSCPNEDCRKDLKISYSRVNIEGVDDENDD